MIPKRGLVYDHVYVKKEYGSWHQWSAMIEKIDIDEKASVSYKWRLLCLFLLKSSS